MRTKEELLESYDIKSWQSLHVKQLSYVRNLFLILSTALTGFVVSLVFSSQEEISIVVYLLKTSGILFLIPISLGLWISINESKNYRLKYKISRTVRRDSKPLDNREYRELEDQCSSLEELNRILFKGQLVVFLLAFICLLVALLLKPL
ncbi:hypothetical protein [Reichenbachiella sp.]